MAILLGEPAVMRREGAERGAVLLELLLVVILAGALFRQAAPAALQLYQYGAVRFEAEHLLSEIRYQQMLARTSVDSMSGDGGSFCLSTRPRLKIEGSGYIRYRGSNPEDRYECLPSVRMQFNGDWDGKSQFLYFGGNGNIYPNITILVFASDGMDINCRLVIDTAGRVRLERSGI